jgi:OFA family oxalate/formate antiporter-like MFS transporter
MLERVRRAARKRFGWTRAETSLVFTIAVVTFAITFIFGGRLQDRRGPRSAALIGAVLVSLASSSPARRAR